MAADFDLLICGAGPAGAAAALTAARNGLRTGLVERAVFPRRKVCGDCLNPSVWPVLEDLGVASRILALEHAPLDRLRLVSRHGKTLEVPLPPGAERAVTREAFDHTLLEAAAGAGVTVLAGSPLTKLETDEGGFHISLQDLTSVKTRALLAADGRNSTVCRLLGLMPEIRPGRVARQCHVPMDPARAGTVSLEFTAHGYCGVAPVSGSRMNLCVVSRAEDTVRAGEEIRQRLGLPRGLAWQSIAPLERRPLHPAPRPGCFLAGDAARVVEPFTGEGIYYALRSGQLAAEAATDWLRGPGNGSMPPVFSSPVPGNSGSGSARVHPPESGTAPSRWPETARRLQTAHARLYGNRLWVNHLARLAVTRPAAGEALLAAGRHFPPLLHWLMQHITGPGTPPRCP